MKAQKNNALSLAWEHASGKFMILLIGLVVESTNFLETFYFFMLDYRPAWGPLNYFFAALLSVLLLYNIVHWGWVRKKEISWGVAVLTMGIAFSVYYRSGIQWNWHNWPQLMVFVILTFLLPSVIAYTTHAIRDSVDNALGKPESEIKASPPPTAPMEELLKILSERNKVEAPTFSPSPPEPGERVLARAFPKPLEFHLNGTKQGKE